MNLEFTNKIHYNQEMAKSAYDKLAFVNKIYENIDLIVDFGCANGIVTRFIRLFYPESKIYGYDLPDIIRYNTDDDIEYKCDLDEIASIVKEYNDQGKKSILIMNSVMHELFNYMKSNKLIADDDRLYYHSLLNKLYNMKFTYIFIRDLNIKIPTFGNNVEYIPSELSKLSIKFKQLGYEEQFEDFLRVYNNGDQLNPMTKEGQEQYIHFLLKCRYKENWNRELPENYLASSSSFNKDGLFLSNTYKYPYHMTDCRKYILPYVQYINNKEFGIDLKKLGITTHSQALYKLNYVKNTPITNNSQN